MAVVFACSPKSQQQQQQQSWQQLGAADTAEVVLVPIMMVQALVRACVLLRRQVAYSVVTPTTPTPPSIRQEGRVLPLRKCPVPILGHTGDATFS